LGIDLKMIHTLVTNSILIFLYLCLLGEGGLASELKNQEKKLHQLSNQEIDVLIRDISQSELTRKERIHYYSQLALDTPYALFCLGEGQKGKYDQDPLIDFSRVDCMTFCEQTIALAISETYQDTLLGLQLIRYHQGTICYITRNHFVIANWLTHNQWLLKDITREAGGILCRKMTKTIDFSLPARSYPGIDRKTFPPLEEQTIFYLPKEHLLKIVANISGGEVIIIITSKEGIFASHMGLLIKDVSGKLVFRHASSRAKKVADELYQDFYERLQRDEKVAGVVIARVKD